ncbi:MAG: hypothetical protein IJ612_05135 [Prevotella sp.]|nr:hypothetical protein [Prevotella sp.]
MEANESRESHDTKADEQEEKLASTLRQIKEQASEDDDTPAGLLTLRTILGGDILSAAMVRRQVWLLLLIVLFISISVAFRYQCQQDQIQIAKLEQQLTDIKYKALASSSALTERTRKSRIMEALRQNNDSVLHTSNTPPYIILVDEDQ